MPLGRGGREGTAGEKNRETVTASVSLSKGMAKF